MPITSGQVTVNTIAPVLIHQTDADGTIIVIEANCSSGQHVYIGPAGLTSENGYIFDGGSNLDITMPPGSALYGLANNNTVVVSKLVHGI